MRRSANPRVIMVQFGNHLEVRACRKIRHIEAPTIHAHSHVPQHGRTRLRGLPAQSEEAEQHGSDLRIPICCNHGWVLASWHH